MKKYFASVLFVAISIFLVSCSNTSSDVGTFDETDTLQYEARRLEEELDWQFEIEGEILTREIKKKDGIDSSRVTLTHRAVLANEKNPDVEKIYPYLEGFGSLDLTDFTLENNKEKRTLVDDFCSALVAGKDCDSFFDKQSLFALAIFYDELNTVSGINYFELIDAVKASELKEDEKKAAQEKGIEINRLGDIKKIDSYILGKPFSAEDYFSVPVRFKVGKSNLDVEIFLEKFSDAWKIDGIEIRKFG